MMDTNGDEQISKKEARGPLKDFFDEVDKNEDGFLSKKELRNLPKPPNRGQSGRR
jgi:Ca2+-binding EF-hand superfamily protein